MFLKLCSADEFEKLQNNTIYTWGQKSNLLLQVKRLSFWNTTSQGVVYEEWIVWWLHSSLEWRFFSAGSWTRISYFQDKSGDLFSKWTKVTKLLDLIGIYFEITITNSDMLIQFSINNNNLTENCDAKESGGRKASKIIGQRLWKCTLCKPVVHYVLVI